MPRVGSLDRAIREALVSFAAIALRPDWRGREREAISLFAFRFLLPHFNGRFPLRHPAQLGIEVCVPGVRGKNPKGRVNKELVIWGSHSMSCWDEGWEVAYAPRAVLEWTYTRTPARWRAHWRRDIEWLRDFTAERRGCVGYAIALIAVPSAPSLQVVRVQRGSANERWLICGAGELRVEADGPGRRPARPGARPLRPAWEAS
jgi:hypothetical protein